MEPSLHQCRAAAVMHAVKLLAGEERKNTTHVLTSNASRKLQLWLISKLGRMKDGPAAFEGLYIERGMSLWEAAIATSCSSGTLTPAVHIAKARTLRFEHGYPYIYIFLFIYLFIYSFCGAPPRGQRGRKHWTGTQFKWQTSGALY